MVIAESTRKLVGNLFELEDLGAHELKGITGAVRAWAALRPSSAESRFEAFHATGLTELVGRDEELDLLLRRWSKAKTGEGQVVLLSGEAGIGKSRLTAALLEHIATEPHTRLRYFCSPQHTDSALFPIISQMERAAGFAHDDTAQAKLDKLDVVLAQTFTPRHEAALFAEMLSLPNDGRHPSLELAPQQRRQKTLEALTAQVGALSQSNPVLMIFEDVHWLDPTSLEVLGRSVDRLRTLGLLLIVTYRPEFEPPWIGRPYVTALGLNRLGEREIAAMIDRVTGNKALPESIKTGHYRAYRWHSAVRQKGALFWKELGMRYQGCVLAFTGQSAEAIQLFNSTITTYRSSGTTAWMPMWSSYLAMAYAEVGHLDEAWKCSGDAITAVASTKERIFEAEVHRVAGDIALMLRDTDGCCKSGRRISTAPSLSRANNKPNPGNSAPP